jgi:hypothetical protein
MFWLLLRRSGELCYRQYRFSLSLILLAPVDFAARLSSIHARRVCTGPCGQLLQGVLGRGRPARFIVQFFSGDFCWSWLWGVLGRGRPARFIVQFFSGDFCWSWLWIVAGRKSAEFLSRRIKRLEGSWFKSFSRGDFLMRALCV